MEYGVEVSNIRTRSEGLSFDDLSRHVYILAGTGTGKTTLVRTMFKHLEQANYHHMYNAAIYIDIKDDDARLFLRQCNPCMTESLAVRYLDINHTNFGINLLELPKYKEGQRNRVVSKMVGYVMSMLKEFYEQQTIYVQLERILKLLLYYLYQNTDCPTMLDLYDIIVRLQADGRSELQQIMQNLKNVSGSEMKLALNAIAGLASDSWTPVLNRIEPFAVDPYLKKIFCVRHSTIDFEYILTPANVTIFRISDTQTPQYAHALAIMAIVIKIWFAVLDRASETSQESRNLVVLALDEFQKIAQLNILTTILSQARSYNLGLILSHQNTAQVSEELLQTILGNTATQIFGRVSGIDSAKIGRAVDPHFAREITETLAVQPDFTFTIRSRAASGQEQQAPKRFKAVPPPPLLIDDVEADRIIEAMRKRYGIIEGNTTTIFAEKSQVSTKWMKQLTVPFLEREVWQVLVALRKGRLNLTNLVDVVRSYNRDRTRKLLNDMANDGLVAIFNTRFAISESARLKYFPDNFDSLGKAEGVEEVARKAFDYHMGKGHFVALAMQDPKEGSDRVDMCAYDYDTMDPISIEIESASECASHPEKVRKNFEKWQDLGFTMMESWSLSPRITEIYDTIDSGLKARVRCFSLNDISNLQGNGPQ